MPYRNAHSQPANTITYSNTAYPSLTTLQAAVDQLLYAPPVISGFTNSVGVVEIGRTITTVPMTWSLNKTMTTLSLDNGIGSLSPSAVSYSHGSQSITANRTYTLTASDGVNSTFATTSVVFQSKRYWGANASASLSDAQILALAGSEFATTRVKSSFSVAGAGGYIYYVFPDSFGTPSFTVNGLVYTDLVLVTRTVVNASGGSVTYRIYRTGSTQSGTLNIAVT